RFGAGLGDEVSASGAIRRQEGCTQTEMDRVSSLKPRYCRTGFFVATLPMLAIDPLSSVCLPVIGKTKDAFHWNCCDRSRLDRFVCGLCKWCPWLWVFVAHRTARARFLYKSHPESRRRYVRSPH